MKRTSASRLRQPSPPHLLLHRLIGSLSFWGSSVRLFLVAFFALLFAAARLGVTSVSPAQAAWYQLLAGEVYGLAYGIGLFFVLDVGYVIVARAYPLRPLADRAVLLIAEVVLALLYFLPHVAQVAYDSARLMVVAPVAVIFLVVLRALLGMLMTQAVPSPKHRK